MEVYYKDLISEDASLEKLIEDISRVVQGAEEFAKAAGEEIRPEDHSRVERLKEGCRKVREQALQGMAATDKVLRRNPYSFAAIAFGVGLLAGSLVCRSVCRGRSAGDRSIDDIE